MENRQRTNFVMKSNLSEQTESDFVKLGIYQIAGGAIGVLYILWALIRSFIISGPAAVIYILFVALYGFSILCGVKCIFFKKDALQYSLINQLMQVVHFSVAGFGFTYMAGFHVSVTIDLTSDIMFGLNASISNIELTINGDNEQTLLGINIVAIWLVYWIDKLMRKAKDENEILVVRQIGNDVEP
ncbi:MAG: hypothetical protein ACTHMM_24215 [Agriterribacter sp.]